jgi:hypothetical protein
MTPLGRRIASSRRILSVTPSGVAITMKSCASVASRQSATCTKPDGAPAGSATSTAKPCEAMNSANQRPILPAPPITSAVRPEPAPWAATLACSWVVREERIRRRRMFSATWGETPYCLPVSRAASSTSRSRL